MDNSCALYNPSKLTTQQTHDWNTTLDKNKQIIRNRTYHKNQTI